MTKRFFPKLAAQNLMKNGRFYYPYLLTVVGCAAAFYIVLALARTPVEGGTRYLFLSLFMAIGTVVLGLFSLIFILYTNRFLMKRRMKELGLYNVLGMAKRDIGRILGWETFYVWLLGAGGGVLAGIVLQKLATMLVARLMRFDVKYGFSLQAPVVGMTLLYFGFVLLVTLAANLRRLRHRDPAALLREGEEGEKEPRSRWILTLLGVVSLGAGYGIAVRTRDPMIAIGVYFIAVFLVIIGTYLLFSAVSIVILKSLRRKEHFYYRTGNFISVSGMLHRMNRNAVGLANLCILSTMVLVMISATLSLYTGTGETLEARCPRDINIRVRYHVEEEDPDWADMEAFVREQVTAAGEEMTGALTYERLQIPMLCGDHTLTVEGPEELDGSRGWAMINFYLPETYRILSDADELPGPGEVLLGGGTPGAPLTLIFGTGEQAERMEFVQREPDPSFRDPQTSVEIGASFDVVVPDRETYLAVARAYARAAAPGTSADRYLCFDVPQDEQAVLRVRDLLANGVLSAWLEENVPGCRDFGISDLPSDRSETYGISGGFLFLGVFLGIIFLMALVLIMYYKQISEGYEDRRRFSIMQQVGLPKSEIRRSIDAQLLVVFFAPLLVAGVHVAFDFHLVRLMLQLFGLFNGALALRCTLLTFGVFTLIYAAVYVLTARVYYRIVSE